MKAFLEWVARNDILVDGRPFDFEHHRYLLPLYEDDSKEQVVLKGAQVGLTTWLFLRLLWWVTEHQGLKAGLYAPTAELIQKMSKDRIGPLIDDNPALRAKLLRGGTLSLRQFGRSSLFLFHIGGSASKDSTPLDVIAFDEVRLTAARDIAQAEERISHSSYKIKYYASTAGLPNADIHARFLRTDQHYFHTKCGCPDGIVLTDVFPDCIAVTPSEVYYRCPRCGFRIRDTQNGRFVPHNPRAETRGYHIHQLLSHYVTPRQVWQTYLETDNKQEFYNAKLGVPYVDPRNVGLLSDEIDACITDAISWDKPTMRPDGQIDGRMCMGIDQMANLNYVTILQQTPVARRLVKLEVIESDDPFKRCYELMKEYRIDVCVVDALPNFNEALRFSHAFPRKVFCAFWFPHATDMVQWSDRKKQPQQTKRTSSETKAPWHVKFNKFMAIEHALTQFRNRRILIPRPDGYDQIFRDRHGFVGPVNLYRHWREHLTSVVRQRRELLHRTEEKKVVHTGSYQYDWIYTRGDPHALDATVYACFAAERLAKRIIGGLL